MGTHFKKSIFDEHIQAGLVGWAQKVKRKKATKGASNEGNSSNGAAVVGNLEMGGRERRAESV